MRSFATILVVSLYVFPVSAEDKTPDIQAYLPLFERNSLGQKILDVRYSVKIREDTDKTFSDKQDAHLVYDVETGKYRMELKRYNRPNETNRYLRTVSIWDGNKSMTRMSHVSPEPESPFLGGRMCESPGIAFIKSRPLFRPFFLDYCLTGNRPWAKVISKGNPRLTSIAGDAITIETEFSKFLFLNTSIP